MKFVTNFKNWSEVKFYLHVMTDKLWSKYRTQVTNKEVIVTLKQNYQPSEVFISHSEIISFWLPDTECEILNFDDMRRKFFHDRDAWDPAMEYFTKEINKRIGSRIVEMIEADMEKTKPKHSVWLIILIIWILYAITKSLSGV